jgi:hypothetical protein
MEAFSEKMFETKVSYFFHLIRISSKKYHVTFKNSISGQDSLSDRKQKLKISHLIERIQFTHQNFRDF